MVDLISFQDALSEAGSSPKILLGNGFSIACKRNIFNYKSLFTRADFRDIPYAPDLFRILETADFEAVIRTLKAVAKLVPYYRDVDPAIADTIEEDAESLKEVLVRSIAMNHPDRPNEISEDEYHACRIFLSHFDAIYTLNYDLLLYWALMHEEGDESNRIQVSIDDGFRSPQDAEDADYVTWEDHQSAKIYFLHGALHLFDAGNEIKKYTWSRTQVALIDQIREALNSNLFPLFVAEADYKEKYNKIMHNAYLHKAYRSLESLSGAIVIFGHSLDENDRHIYRAILKKRRNKRLFVSLYGHPNSDENRTIIERARRLTADAGLGGDRLRFFDAASAAVWG